MFQTFSAHNFHSFCNKLAAKDKGIAAIIKEHGYPPMWKRPNTFETLVHIILEQQVSLASALASLKKLQQKTKAITPATILALNDEELKACYVSRQKAIYIRGLAQAIKNGQISLDELAQMPNDDIRTKLIQMKGIGNWTIDIYLIFVLQRADIFPMGDLAAVNALKRLRQFEKATSKETLLAATESWKPYRTIATMLLWHHYLSAPIKKQVFNYPA